MPHLYVPLNAFNLTVGATFTEGYEGDALAPIWIVMHVTRSSDKEDVYVWARRADIITEGPGDSVENRSFVFDFCDKVALIGHCLNPMDPDDNDWGQ